ncbi:ECF transporter S component [Niallia sp. 01092]|uniref:ECF transporter S component n=1 Tax=unclassified Niallia TaxID=2837522 RepID=UPI003FD27EE0
MNGKKISILALFIALSAVGAYIKIPAHVGSVALDSFPSLIAGVLLGGISGGIVAGVGHLLSALIIGFPLGPFHFIISVEMSLLICLFSYIYRSGKKYFAYAVFIIVNSIILPIPFLFLINKGFYTMIIPSLLIGAVINAAAAYVLIPRLQSISLWRKSRL